jgi:PleD family two-component response regulator
MPVAQRVRQAVERHAWQPRGVTVSVGLASLVPGKDVPAQQLLERADHALLLAKRRGRNRVEAFAGWQPL